MTSEIEICSVDESCIRTFCSTCHAVDFKHCGCDLGVDSGCGNEDGEGDVDADDVDGGAAVDVEADGGAEDDKDYGCGCENPYCDLGA